MKYVERSEALLCATGLYDTEEEREVVRTIGKKLKDLPYIESEEKAFVKYGKWISLGNSYQCTDCGYKWDKDFIDNNDVRYCPHCGTKNRIELEEI
jgi:DNA-directed RNA polymerase subunit RPC12/RpoP